MSVSYNIAGWMPTIFGPQQSLVAFSDPHMHGRVLVRNGLGVFEGIFDILLRQFRLLTVAMAKLP